MTRPIRFAASAPQELTRKSLVTAARKAEAQGYSSMLIADHLLPTWSALPALLAAAMVTKKLRIGTFVLNNDLRHPAMLAKEASTIDVLTDGRFELGIGAGWNKPEYDATGITWDTPGVRIDRLTESVAILKGLWAGGPFSFAGKHYQITNLENHPAPVSKPHPKLMIGGGGRRTLTLAGKEADIVGLAPRAPSPDRVEAQSFMLPAAREKVAWIKEAAGERFASLELNTYPSLGNVTITNTAKAMAKAYAERMSVRFPGADVKPDDLLDSPHFWAGTRRQLAEKVKRLNKELGINYFMIAGDLDAFAPVVEELTGS